MVLDERTRPMMVAFTSRSARLTSPPLRDLTEEVWWRPIVPDHIGSQHQRDEPATLSYGLTGYAGVSMRRAQVVRRMKSINPQHSRSAGRGLVNCRTADCTQPNDDNVGRDHLNYCRKKSRWERCQRNPAGTKKIPIQASA